MHPLDHEKEQVFFPAEMLQVFMGPSPNGGVESRDGPCRAACPCGMQPKLASLSCSFASPESGLTQSFPQPVQSRGQNL